MTAVAEQVYQEAINLNPIDRAELIERLYLTFSNKNSDIELSWKKEVSRRRSAYDKGEIPSDTIENVFERLGQR